MSPRPIALWVVPVADLGGVARHVLDVARVGIPGWRLMVFCPEGPLADRLREGGHAVLTAEFGPDAGVLTSVRALRRTIRTLRPRVVHSHLAYADIVAVLATRGLPVRLISTEHGIAPDEVGLYQSSRSKALLMSQVHHLRTGAFDHLIAVCQSTKDVMERKWRPKAPITVIRNGVDRPAHPPVREPGLRFASLARLAPEKRIDVLLDAFALVHAEHPEARLTVAGTGPLHDELVAQAERLDLADAVQFPGFVSAADVLSTHDVVVQLSTWENCSYTLLDACAAGLGVVATDVGGNAEFLPPACLAAEHSPRGIAAAMAQQARHITHRPALSSAWPDAEAMGRQIAHVYGGSP